MRTSPMKMCGYIPSTLVATIYIGRLWKLTAWKLLSLSLRI